MIIIDFFIADPTLDTQIKGFRATEITASLPKQNRLLGAICEFAQFINCAAHFVNS